MSVIGKSITRPDAIDKVTGGKGYPVNYSMPRMLHAKLLRSPYPHAKIKNIDTSAAEALPGVKAVLTPAECPTRKFTPVYFVPSDTVSMPNDFLIMSDTVRFAGQPVAAVAATSLDVAEQALDGRMARGDGSVLSGKRVIGRVGEREAGVVRVEEEEVEGIGSQRLNLQPGSNVQFAGAPFKEGVAD